MTIKFQKITEIILSCILLGVSLTAVAETPEEKGYAIFKEADQRNQGVGGSTESLLMILRDKNGGASEREMRTKILEGVSSQGDKMLLVFDTPKDQRGTALLTHSHDNRDSDQWLYLPALKRVKKIASSSKSGPFMGSEFSFEDFGSAKLGDYRYRWLRDEDFQGQDCYVVESIPKSEDSGYTKTIVWIDKQAFRTLKIDFFDRKNSHFKTLTGTDFKLYENQFWRPGLLTMVNLQTGKSTELHTRELKFKQNLKDSDFSQKSLERAR